MKVAWGSGFGVWRLGFGALVEGLVMRACGGAINVSLTRTHRGHVHSLVGCAGRGLGQPT